MWVVVVLFNMISLVQGVLFQFFCGVEISMLMLSECIFSYMQFEVMQLMMSSLLILWVVLVSVLMQFLGRMMFVEVFMCGVNISVGCLWWMVVVVFLMGKGVNCGVLFFFCVWVLSIVIDFGRWFIFMICDQWQLNQLLWMIRQCCFWVSWFIIVFIVEVLEFGMMVMVWVWYIVFRFVERLCMIFWNIWDMWLSEWLVQIIEYLSRLLGLILGCRVGMERGQWVW